MKQPPAKTYEELQAENEALRSQLQDATETLEAIRTGAVDALVVQRDEGHELYTLQTADAGYRVFIENMNEGAITLSDDGVILYANAAFARLAEIPAGSALGTVLTDLLTEESVPAFTGLLKGVWEGDGKAFVLFSAGSRVVPCQLSATPLDIDAGPVLSVIVTDLSAQKEAETQLNDKAARLQEAVTELESSNYDLQQFASVASHDLQEPLRKIMLFGSMLRKSAADKLTETDIVALDKIIASSARLKTMVSDVLSFSRLAAPAEDSEAAEPEQAHLNAIVGGLLEDFEMFIKDRSAKVVVEDLPVVAVRPAAVRQVLQNLLSNAIKFCRPDVQCSVRISRANASLVEEQYRDESRFALISVADNGIGFDEKFRDRVFGLFQRLNTKDKYEGSGIGLAVAKRLMERAGGAISVRSTEGKGTEFILALPVV